MLQTSPAPIYAAFEHKESLLSSVQWISVAVIISPPGKVSVALSTTTETQKTPFLFSQGANVENLLLSHSGVVTDWERTSQLSFPR